VVVSARLSPSLDAAGDLLKTLSAPVRLAIVVELARRPLCVHDLVDALGASQSLVSQHLRVLRSAQLVAGSRRGREIEYRLVDEHVAHIVQDAIRHSEEDKA
jgi:DNA-binding transcriptional ArsR family regulator